MKIGRADSNERPVLVAEIGNNHEGSVELAAELIKQAAACGADAVKLQTLVPELLTVSSETARIEQLKRFALSFDATKRLVKKAADDDITVFATPLDLQSARFLRPLQSVFKIASGDITYVPLLQEVASYGADLIVSTGASDLDEVIAAVGVITTVWDEEGHAPQLALLHCVSCYPADERDANLRAIATLAGQFPQATVGYSDHTMGIDVAAASAYAGARIVEKHFTLDKQQSDFRDHQLSADPAEFRALRAALDRAARLLGQAEKQHVAAEGSIRTAIRRSIATARPLAAGETIAPSDVVCLRPADGLSPARLDEVVGRTLTRDYDRGELVDPATLT